MTFLYPNEGLKGPPDYLFGTLRSSFLPSGPSVSVPVLTWCLVGVPSCDYGDVPESVESKLVMVVTVTCDLNRRRRKWWHYLRGETDKETGLSVTVGRRKLTGPDKVSGYWIWRSPRPLVSSPKPQGYDPSPVLVTYLNYLPTIWSFNFFFFNVSRCYNSLY